MANAKFALGAEKILNGDIDWTNDDFKILLLDADDGYTPNTSTDEFRDDVTAGVVATSANLSGKTSTGGLASCSDVTFSGLSGDQFERVILFKDTGVAGTSPLLILFDTKNGGGGISVTPSGNDLIVSFPSGLFQI